MRASSERLSHRPGIDASAASPRETGRRDLNRLDAGLQPCCLIASEIVATGRIVNFSFGGACIEIDAELEIGEDVRYFWATNCSMLADIVWRQGRTYGLRHVDMVHDADTALPHRSMRIPCHAPAECFVGGERHATTVENVSVGGLLMSGMPDVVTAARLSISVCDLKFHNVQLRWSEHGRAGLRLREPMTRDELVRLLLDQRFAVGNMRIHSPQARALER